MKRIVIKVGSRTISHDSGLLNLRKMEQLAQILSDLSNAGNEVILVSSGAMAAGRGKMHVHERPMALKEKQALASIGQCELMYIYDKFFSQYSKIVAQMLMTKNVVVDENLRQNASNTIETLLKQGVIPIINENDSVATDEIVYGDNDTLSAITAKLVHADLLIVLSDIDGFYDKNPTKFDDATLLSRIEAISDDIEAMADDTNNDIGTGGMITKIKAAKIATESGCDMLIISGSDFNNIYKVMDGEVIGTLFKAKRKELI